MTEETGETGETEGTGETVMIGSDPKEGIPEDPHSVEMTVVDNEERTPDPSGITGGPEDRRIPARKDRVAPTSTQTQTENRNPNS